MYVDSIVASPFCCQHLQYQLQWSLLETMTLHRLSTAMLYRHLKNVSGHLLKKFAGNLLNCLASKGVAVDHVRAFLSHMSDTTHLDYLESFVPAAILLAGHGPDWQNHHRIGRDVQVPDELLTTLCPGLPHLMEAYPGKLHLFKHLMVVMIQVNTTAAAEATVGPKSHCST